MDYVTKSVLKWIGGVLTTIVVLVVLYGVLVLWQAGRQEKDLGERILKQDLNDVQLPDGVPVYPGAKIESASDVFRTYRFSTEDSPEAVLNFYTSYFKGVSSNYEVTFEKDVPREGSGIAADFISKIVVTDPSSVDHSYIAEVSSYRDGSVTFLSIRFPVGD